MSLFHSFLIGLAGSSIPGPIFFETSRRTLTKGFWSGALLGVGEFIGNFMILILVFSGISTFLTTDTSKMILYLMGSLIFFWICYNAFKINKEEIEKSYSKKLSKNNSIYVGIAIAVTNPIPIAMWISISGSYLTQFTTQIAYLNIFIIAFTGIFFFSFLAGLVHLTRHKISIKNVILTSKIFGMILLFYGLMFLYKFFTIVIEIF